MDIPTGDKNEAFNGGGVLSTGELLVFSLLLCHNWHGTQLLVDVGIYVENLLKFNTSFFIGDAEASIAF